MIDFRLSDECEALRVEIRTFLAEHFPADREEEVYRSGVSNSAAFTKALAERGWLAPDWPKEYGGEERDPLEMVVLNEELRFEDAPTYGIGTTTMVANVIRHAGTDEQRRDYLPRTINGDIVMVLGFSEPEAGSDVAAAATRAVRDGDDWVINGSKMFTTNGHIADYAFLLARTNPDAPKHKGLTMFLVPMDDVEAQAVFTLSGERTNITYYNDVRVPDSMRVGPVDQGWATLNVALASEHGTGYGPMLHRLLDAAERWAGEATDDDGAPRLEDPDVREALARAATDLEVSRLLQRRVAWMAEVGLKPLAEGPMSKLLSSEALKARAQELVEVIGPDALRSYFDPTAPVRGVIEHLQRFSLGTAIYAGTSEIHRNMIAQRGLGLPRAR